MTSRRLMHTKRLFFFPVLLLLFLNQPILSQQIRINELVSSNNTTFSDEDGDTPDWLELYNAGPIAVNLGGYGITDDATFPYQWIFPNYVLDSGQFLLIAASGKDRRDTPLFWETRISQNDTFRYLVPDADPGLWVLPVFNDSAWSTGRSGFGYGDNDDSTLVPEGTLSVLMRKAFEVHDLSLVRKMLLHVDFDDAFVAYINGHEIARSNIGTPGVQPSWNELAHDYSHEAVLPQYGTPDAFPCDSALKYLVEGTNVFAIEVHNSGEASSDLSCTSFLSLGYIKLPDDSRGVASFLRFTNSFYHLNFKIDASGDTLLLTNTQGVLIDSIFTGEIPADISLGLQPDGVSSRWYFSVPTPGKSNATKAYPVLSFTDPVFPHPGGFYTSPFDLEISGAEPGDSIWYTVNGSLPGKDDLLYTGPVHISESRVIRAIILGAERMNRKPITQSYLFRDEAPTLTTISLSTDSLNFFDPDTGIYVMGPNASTEQPNYGANFWMDWERPIHIELFETNGSKAMEADAGVKIFGGWSRAQPQKSLAFFSRGKYGDKSFRYKLFPELPFDDYNNFILRNSGNDWNSTMIRDAMITSLLDQTNVDRQAYRPASVYLNGQYWGLLNIREKVNEHFVAAHHQIDPLQIDLLEWNASPLNGDADHYLQMIELLTSQSPSIKENYDQVKTMMDVENFMEYQLAQIFINNTDWPGNNIKYWRPKTPGGRWKWIIYDTDFGFDRYTNNTLAFALATNSTDYANAPWATFLLRRLLENQEFKYEFINRFADRMNTVFSYTHVLQRINSMAEVIQHEMPYHYVRWNRWGEDIWYWNYNLELMRNFALERVPYMRLYISEQFGNIGYAALTVNTSTTQSGTVQLNTLHLKSFPWTGTYFKKVPVQLTATPKTGYRFVTWEGPVDEPLSATTLLTITGNTTVRAVFEPDGSNLNDVVINEIYYDDPSDFDADDWIELYNKGKVTMNLSGWILKDEEEDHLFVFPPETYINPGEYLVLCRDTTKFSFSYPGTEALGEFDFGLGNEGDCVRLYTRDSILVDTVRYGVSPPWPSAPNDYGTSIELIQAGYDNSLAVNWTESLYAHGTPGEINSLSTGTEENNTDNLVSREMLLEAYPNPFSYITTIRYEVAERERIHISITDIQGNQLAILHHGEVDPGIKEIVWDGYGTAGKRLPPGVYILSLETKSSKKYLRLVIL